MDFSDLPFDVINGCIAKYLLEDKKINKIFHEHEDIYLQMLLFGEIKKLPYVIRYETNTYKVQNDVLKAYVNRILRGFKINEEVHSIIVNFDFHPLESEIDYNEMWIEFKNESDELIARIYNDYILKIYVYDLICAKVRKAEIKAIFNDLQERTNMKIIDYFEELEKEFFY
jgi:hypothetical protein